RLNSGTLEYFCNTLVSYAIRGVQTKLNVIWDWEVPAGSGDTHFSSYRGTRARIEVRQTRADRFRPELYVVPATGALKLDVHSAVRARIAAVQAAFPGVSVDDRGAELRVAIP